MGKRVLRTCLNRDATAARTLSTTSRHRISHVILYAGCCIILFVGDCGWLKADTGGPCSLILLVLDGLKPIMLLQILGIGFREEIF